MPSNRIPAAALAAVAVALFALPGGRGAGTNAAEEAAIRKAIVAVDGQGSQNRPVMQDMVFWSGAFKKPTVGNEKGEPRSVPRGIEQRVPGSEKHKTEVIRIVVADSHDLAYEYSKSTIEFDLKSGEHTSFDSGVLRVWQKDGGEWKTAAMFARPYEQ